MSIPVRWATPVGDHDCCEVYPQAMCQGCMCNVDCTLQPSWLIPLFYCCYVMMLSDFSQLMSLTAYKAGEGSLNLPGTV